MKCPACGYLSFDNLERCKKCGASLLSLKGEESDERESLYQADLFSSSVDEEGSVEEETEVPPTAGDEEDGGEGEPFFPGGDDGLILDAGATVSIAADAGTPGEEEVLSSGPPGEAAPIIDDESGIPEDLWIEEGAGFLVRMQALAVDLSILGGVLLLFLISAVLVLSTSGYGWARLKTPEGIAALFLPFYLLGLLLCLSYFTFFLGWSGRTPGKALFNLDVRRTDGGEMTYTRGFLRGVGYLVSLTFAGLGFLWILFDERRRGWHDYLSGTWVKDRGSEG